MTSLIGRAKTLPQSPIILFFGTPKGKPSSMKHTRRAFYASEAKGKVNFVDVSGDLGGADRRRSGKVEILGLCLAFETRSFDVDSAFTCERLLYFH